MLLALSLCFLISYKRVWNRIFAYYVTEFQQLRKCIEKTTRHKYTWKFTHILLAHKKSQTDEYLRKQRARLWVIASQFVMQEGCGSFYVFLLQMLFHSPALYVIKLTHKPQALDRKDSNRLSVVGRLMSTHSYHLMAHFLLKHMDYSGIIKQK